MTYYAALDVSLRSVAVCIIHDQGQCHFEAKIPSEVENIVECLEAFDGEIELIGFEAGMLTQYLQLRFDWSGLSGGVPRSSSRQRRAEGDAQQDR